MHCWQNSTYLMQCHFTGNREASSTGKENSSEVRTSVSPAVSQGPHISLCWLTGYHSMPSLQHEPLCEVGSSTCAVIQLITECGSAFDFQQSQPCSCKSWGPSEHTHVIYVVSELGIWICEIILFFFFHHFVQQYLGVTSHPHIC